MTFVEDAHMGRLAFFLRDGQLWLRAGGAERAL